MPVTIRDVAKRLNLSITTVSRALDGYADVAEGTRQKVIEMAREMGYVPNRAARQLRKTWLMAGSVIITIPIVVLFFFFERFLTRGLTAGAVKG